MTQEEYDKLCSEFGKNTIDQTIRKMDAWLDAKGKIYKHYAKELKLWIIKDKVHKPDMNEKMSIIMPKEGELKILAPGMYDMLKAKGKNLEGYTRGNS